MKAWSHLDPRLDPYADEDHSTRIRIARIPGAARTRVQDRERGLSVIILTLDKPELIIPLARDLAAQAAFFAARGLGLEILIGDTGSTDPRLLAFYEDLPAGIRVRRGLRYQFSRCNNQVFREMARYDTALFLNNDVVVRANPACLMAMMEALDATPEAGIAGLVMFFGDGTTVQHAGIDFFRGGPLHGLCFHPGSREKKQPGDFAPLRPVAAVTGACLMIRSGLFEGLGGFEEAYAAEAQDVDLCLKARRLGRRALLLQAGSILHLENATRPKGEENWADRRLFIRRWGSFIDTVFPEALLP